jgi:asparagine synthase (glutamine-hydrolysing)
MGRVPAKWKIMGLKEKHILKESFQGILPDEITARSKHPYRAPIKQSLLNEKTAEYTREALSEKSLEKAGLFDAGKVTRLLRKLETLDSPSEIDNMALVGILSSQLVYNQFIEDFPAGGGRSASLSLLVDQRSEALRSTN